MVNKANNKNAKGQKPKKLQRSIIISIIALMLFVVLNIIFANEMRNGCAGESGIACHGATLQYGFFRLPLLFVIFVALIAISANIIDEAKQDKRLRTFKKIGWTIIAITVVVGIVGFLYAL